MKRLETVVAQVAIKIVESQNYPHMLHIANAVASQEPGTPQFYCSDLNLGQRHACEVAEALRANHTASEFSFSFGYA